MSQVVGGSRVGAALHTVNSTFSAGRDINLTTSLTVNNESSILNRLKAALKPVPSASFDSYEADRRCECFRDTRVQVLSAIEAWIAADEQQAPIYVLDGVAGIGKSTVAQTIAARAAKRGILGASFFFSRDEELRKIARYFFPTIAYQLASHEPTFAQSICDLLEKTPDAPEKGLQQQLMLLLVGPLQGLLSQRVGPTLLIVDAVDECEEEDRAQELLTLLGAHVHRLHRLKILITARPELHLRHVLDQDENHQIFRLHDIEDYIVQSDIRLYLESQLSSEAVRKMFPSRRKARRVEWQPSETDMEMLCGICGTLFIIASTAAKFILDPKQLNPQKQLSRLLEGVSTKDFSGSKYTKVLDETYVRILCAAQSDANEGDEEWFDDYNKVLGTLLTLASPLDCQALSALIEMNAVYIDAVLSPLHSLVAPLESGDKVTYYIHHKSFPDFITNRERIQRALSALKQTMRSDLDLRLWIDVKAHHLTLAKACFCIMNRDLKQNIAGIAQADWYRNNVDIPYLNPKLISRDLAYASMHWSSHLLASQKLDDDAELQEYFKIWASRHILAWIEVLSIVGRIDGIYKILQDAIDSVKALTTTAWVHRERIQALLSDTYRFVQQGNEIMKLSTMQVYRSCLSFLPSETALYHAYGGLAGPAVKSITHANEENWDPLIATLIGHSKDVTSVAFSNDDSRLASGSLDRTVRLWDAKTGVHISNLTGHLDWVTSVAFSHSGPLLASGSYDTTIRLWNFRTSSYVFTLRGHSAWVNDVAFSSSLLASASDDKTIRIWNYETYTCIFTLDGHSRIVQSVAFSNDGSQLVSGSTGIGLRSVIGDGTIRFWDAKEGTNVGTMCQDGWVVDVDDEDDEDDGIDFNNNGNAELDEGELGNSSDQEDNNNSEDDVDVDKDDSRFDEVKSVIFSNNTSRIAFGSETQYGAVEIWDCRTAICTSTLTGHAGDVPAVTFSKDDSILVSGSVDCTIRLWNSMTGANISIFTGHAAGVLSVALSSSGSTIASGSSDNTIRLWDITAETVTYQTKSFTFPPPLPESNDKTTHTADLESNDNTSDSEAPAEISSSADFDVTAFSSDGSLLASGSSDGLIQLWDLKTGVQSYSLVGHSEGVQSAAFSINNSFASGSWDKTVRLWDVMTGHCIFTLEGHSAWVNSVAFSNDGLLLASSSYDHTIRLWDTKTGVHVSTLRGHSSSVVSAVFLGNGLHLASGSRHDGIQLWDVQTGEHLYTFAPHLRGIRPIVVSSKCSLLASVSDDDTIRLWDVGTTDAHPQVPVLKMDGYLVKQVVFINTLFPFISFIPPHSGSQGAAGAFPNTSSEVRDKYPDFLLILAYRQTSPSLKGLFTAALKLGGEWEVTPVLWFPPRIRPYCFAINSANSKVAVGCACNRVLLLDFSAAKI